ncbi:amidohydrolase family protein, partial [Enterococcus faecium]|uniref:amidohydrolase family protein n=1 Tax=Enterococcus faecium TaxID=1352 RepID=UPI00117827BA
DVYKRNVSTEDFFNYCRLEESGVTVTSGTDLPLFITDIPESIIRAVFRRFPEGEEVWEKETSFTTTELLKSFTSNSFKVNGLSEYGEIKVGKSASLAVFSEDLCTDDWQKVMAAEVIATYLDGDLVYKK